MRHFIPHGARTLLVLAAAVALTSNAMAQKRPTTPASRLAGVAAPNPVTAGGKVEVVVRLVDAPLAVAMAGTPSSAAGRSTRPRRELISQRPARQAGRRDGADPRARRHRARPRQQGAQRRHRRDRRQPGSRPSRSCRASTRAAASATTSSTSARPCRTSARRRCRPRASTAPACAVAVLDSGIDYTHRNLGGPGTAAAYDACYGAATRRPAETTLRRPVPDRQGRGRLRLRRRGVAATARCARGPEPDRLRRATARTSPTSSPAERRRLAQGRRAGRQALWRSRSAARSRPPATASRCCRAWTSRSTPTGTATSPTRSTSSTCRSARRYGQSEDDLSLRLRQRGRRGRGRGGVGRQQRRPARTSSARRPATPEVISVAQTQVPSAVAYALVDQLAGQHRRRLSRNTATRRLGADRRRLQRRRRLRRAAPAPRRRATSRPARPARSR